MPSWGWRCAHGGSSLHVLGLLTRSRQPQGGGSRAQTRRKPQDAIDHPNGHTRREKRLYGLPVALTRAMASVWAHPANHPAICQHRPSRQMQAWQVLSPTRSQRRYRAGASALSSWLPASAGGWQGCGSWRAALQSRDSGFKLCQLAPSQQPAKHNIGGA